MEEDYILDRFNLTGLNVEVQHYTHALDLITDNLGESHVVQMLRRTLIQRLYGIFYT